MVTPVSGCVMFLAGTFERGIWGRMPGMPAFRGKAAQRKEMVLMGNDIALEPVESAVLRELGLKTQRPMDLLKSLSDAGYTTREIKRALAELLHDGRIELTSDQRLLPRAA